MCLGSAILFRTVSIQSSEGPRLLMNQTFSSPSLWKGCTAGGHVLCSLAVVQPSNDACHAVGHGKRKRLRLCEAAAFVWDRGKTWWPWQVSLSSLLVWSSPFMLLLFTVRAACARVQYEAPEGGLSKCGQARHPFPSVRYGRPWYCTVLWCGAAQLCGPAQ